MSVLRDRIPDIIPCQKFHMSRGIIFDSYRARDTWNSVWFEPNIEHHGHSSCSIKNLVMQFLFSLYFSFMHHVFCVTPYMGIRWLRSNDCNGQFFEPPWPVYLSRTCSFMYSVMCWLKYGVLHYTGSISIIMFCVVKILNSVHTSVITENQIYVHTKFLTGNDLKNKILKYLT
jgi:hypothetical protein